MEERTSKRNVWSVKRTKGDMMGGKGVTEKMLAVIPFFACFVVAECLESLVISKVT